jgi:hypothetical protein
VIRHPVRVVEYYPSAITDHAPDDAGYLLSVIAVDHLDSVPIRIPGILIGLEYLIQFLQVRSVLFHAHHPIGGVTITSVKYLGGE